METSIENDPWNEWCSVTELAFRAACNVVAEPRSRPVKRRVIGRLSGSTEAQRLFAEVGEEVARRNGPLSESAFFEELVARREWATLVVEAISAEHRWGDLFGDFPSAVDHVQAFWEKCLGKDASTAARVASTVALGLGSLVTVHWVAPETLHLPVHVEWTGDKNPLLVSLTPDESGSPIALTVKGPEGETALPVRIEASSEDKPIKLHFEADELNGATPAAALNDVSAQLKRTNQALEATTVRIQDLVRLTSDTNPRGVLHELKNLGNEVDKLTVVVQSEADASKGQMSVLRDNLLTVAGTTIGPHERVETTLRPSSAQSVVLPVLDPDGRTIFSTVTLCIGRIDVSRPTVALDIVTGQADTPCNSASPRPIPEGGERSYPELGWKVTVKAIQHHWFGAPSATVTLSPVAVRAQITAASSPSGG
jgi:hypothetical protein